MQTLRSSPVTAQGLAALASPAEQAAYLSHFRADSIVRDCEVMRERVCKAGELAPGRRRTCTWMYMHARARL